MNRLRVIVAAAPVMMYAAPVVAETPAALAAFAYDFVGSAVTTDPSGRSHQQVMMRGHATSTGDKTRIDITEAGSAESMRGSYLLLSDGGRRALWVSPMVRQYRETDPETLLSGLGGFANGSNSIVSMAASNIHVDAGRVGSGPMIQGHNTVHYRLYQSMDMKTKIFNKTLTTHDESVTDYYYATDVPNVVNPFLSSAPALPEDGALVFSDDYTRQLRTAIDKLYQGGAPLRTIVSDKSTDTYGHMQSSVTTTEMMNLKQTDVRPELFDVPLGFTAVLSHVSQLDDQGDGSSVSSNAFSPLSPTPADLPTTTVTGSPTPAILVSPLQHSAVQRPTPSLSSYSN
ncbi:MAG TPA: hypothetical protein VNU46_06120 [Gemmatimonadaceae bacterium]|jgi:hypothetical protein|nr:hypothetical protein [Gemmatimonadaceae bacterium]